MKENIEAEYLALASQLAMARVRFAQEWQFARVRANSDGQATQMAIEKTKDEITILQAKMRVMEGKL